MGFFETEKSNPLTSYLIRLSADYMEMDDLITGVERLQVVDGALILTGPQRELLHIYAPGVWALVAPEVEPK
jgi:hypothetical protein